MRKISGKQENGRTTDVYISGAGRSEFGKSTDSLENMMREDLFVFEKSALWNRFQRWLKDPLKWIK